MKNLIDIITEKLTINSKTKIINIDIVLKQKINLKTL